MDHADRLAALLAGDLDAPQRTALEAELARDPELRAQLAAMRRADAALEDVEAVVTPSGFEDRLDAAMVGPLAEELGVPPETLARPATPEAGGGDELAARRARRVPRWVPAVSGAAAALVLVVAGVTMIGPFGGDDQADTVGTMAGGPTDRRDEPASQERQELEDEDLDADAADDAGSADDAPAQDDAGDTEVAELDAAGGVEPAGPALVVGDRELDEALAVELLEGPETDAVRQRALDGDAGAAVGAAWENALLAGAAVEVPVPDDDGAAQLLQLDVGALTAPDAAPDQPEDDAAPEAEPVDDVTAIAVPSVRTDDGAPPGADDLDALAGCLLELDRTVAPRVPAYAELGRVDGRDALLLVVVTPDSDGRYVDVRSIVLDRDDCAVISSVDEGRAP